MAERYAFRPMTEQDLPSIAAWLAEPHVARWMGEIEQEKRAIAGHLGDDAVSPFIILIDGAPVGYLQSYDPHREADHPYRDQPVGTLGIDQFIGRPDMLGKGHGPRLIDLFVRGLFAAGTPRVVLDPDPANTVAIRAYAKAGFTVVGPRTSIYGPALFMKRDPQDQVRTS